MPRISSRGWWSAPQIQYLIGEDEYDHDRRRRRIPQERDTPMRRSLANYVNVQQPFRPPFRGPSLAALQAKSLENEIARTEATLYALSKRQKGRLIGPRITKDDELNTLAMERNKRTLSRLMEESRAMKEAEEQARLSAYMRTPEGRYEAGTREKLAQAGERTAHAGLYGAQAGEIPGKIAKAEAETKLLGQRGDVLESGEQRATELHPGAVRQQTVAYGAIRALTGQRERANQPKPTRTRKDILEELKTIEPLIRSLEATGVRRSAPDKRGVRGEGLQAEELKRLNDYRAYQAKLMAEWTAPPEQATAPQGVPPVQALGPTTAPTPQTAAPVAAPPAPVTPIRPTSTTIGPIAQPPRPELAPYWDRLDPASKQEAWTAIEQGVPVEILLARLKQQFGD